MGKSPNFAGSLVSFVSPGVADTTFAVEHGLGRVPYGAFVAYQQLNGVLYAAQPDGMRLPTGFIGGWEFEDGGNLGADSGPNALTLTNSGVTQTASGLVGNAGAFVTASSQFLSRNSEALLQTGDIDFTWTAWAYPTATGRKFIVGKDNNVAGQREYALFWDNTNGFRAGVYRATDSEVAVNTGGSFVGLNQWYFVVLWHNATADTVNLQVNNGTIFTTATGGALQAASSAQLQVGARQFSTARDFWNGRIDQVMFWKRTLTAAERSVLYNSGAGVAVAPVLAGTLGPSTTWTDTLAYLQSTAVNATYRVLFFA